MNTPITDGNGGITVRLSQATQSEPQCIQDSVMEHENSHIADILAAHPDIAKTAPANVHFAPANDDVLKETEIKAHNVHINYLENLLKDPNRDKANCPCAKITKWLRNLRKELKRYEEM